MRIKAILFPGQGSQYVGMGKELCQSSPIARQTFEEAEEILGFPLKQLCMQGKLPELTSTENAQPAILTAGVAAFRDLQERTGICPHYMAGHSLGEFTALTCAGVLSFADALRLVRKRGLLMKEAAQSAPGLMSAVGKLEAEVVEAVCRGISRPGHVVMISNYNTPTQNVISGHAEAVKEAEEVLASMGAAVKRLNVSAPFHCSLMEPVAREFRKELEGITPGSFRCPVIANVTARPYESTEELTELLTQQIVQPVRWTETMAYFKAQELSLAIDVGPGKVVRNLARNNNPAIQALSLDVWEDRLMVDSYMKIEYRLPFISRCMGLAVATKNNCLDDAAYEAGVVRPYERLQAMQQALDGREATTEEKLEALGLLKKIFATKQVPMEEQQHKLRRLALDTEEMDLPGLL